MSKHSELTKEAYGLAGRLDYRNTEGNLTVRGAATMLRTLADIVKADTRKLEAFDGLLQVAKTAIASWRVMSVNSVLGEQDRRACDLSRQAAEAILAKATTPDAPGKGDNDGVHG